MRPENPAAFPSPYVTNAQKDEQKLRAYLASIGEVARDANSSGMTLRDYFAAAALQGIMASKSEEDGLAITTAEDVARWSYETADAMLAERGKAK